MKEPVMPDTPVKYKTFVADPPWQYGNVSTRNAAANHYSTMSIQALCDLDIVPNNADDNAHLYLWTTASHIFEARDVMEAWGFTYKTNLVWVKPQMGMGNYFRVSHEHVLFGVRGSMRTNTKNTLSWFSAPRQKHSQKPASFHQLVMANSPGPYMELFSRCLRTRGLQGDCLCSHCLYGWKVYGNESANELAPADPVPSVLGPLLVPPLFPVVDDELNKALDVR